MYIEYDLCFHLCSECNNMVLHDGGTTDNSIKKYISVEMFRNISCFHN